MSSRRTLFGLTVLAIVAAGAPSAALADPPTATGAPSCTKAGPTASDFDGDGQADAIVGSPTATVGRAASAGLVTVVYGSKASFDPDRVTNLDAGSPQVGGKSKARAGFGTAVEVAYLDDDGCADVIVGAPGVKVSHAKAAGASYLIFGAPGGLGTGRPSLMIRAGSPGVPGTPTRDDAFGSVIASNRGLVANHLVAFGVPLADSAGKANSGAVIVVEIGADGAPIPSSGWAITQESPGIPDKSTAGDKFGVAVAVGDPQSDGSLGAVFVGAPGEDHGLEHESGALTVIDGPNLSPPIAEQWIQGRGPLSDSPEQPDRFGNSVAYGSDPATGQIALLIGAPGEEVRTIHEAGAAHLLDGCTKLADCQETFLTQGSGAFSDQPEYEDRFGARLSFAPTSATQTTLLGIVGVPGEKVGDQNDAGIVQLIDTQDHSTVYPVIDESLADIPGEAVAGDRFGDALAVLPPSPHGWLGMLVIGVPGKDSGAGVVVTVPFAWAPTVPTVPAPPATKPRLWDPGVGAIPAIDLGFGSAVGGTPSVG